jgi:DNA polymerase-3 subunit gamma/tau
VVPDAIDNSWGDAERVAQIARSITAEDAQLFYQMALNGKRDIALSPDPRRGFEMILLRMVAFRPAAVIDDSLRMEDLQSVVSPQVAAGEGGASVKKFAELPGHLPGKAPKVEAQPSAGQTPSAVGFTERSTGQFMLDSLTPDSWSQLLESLCLKGIVYNIAAHCELRNRAGDQLQFVLDEAHAALFNDSHCDKLRMALGNYFGHAVAVSITSGELRGETPAKRLARLAGVRQAEAVVAIESDLQLQALIARFDGELDQSSILPTDV